MTSVKAFFAKTKNILDKKYFKYEFKKNLLPILVMAALASVFFIVQILNTDFTFNIDEFDYEPYEYYQYPNSLISVPIIILAILCTLVPVLMFSFKMSAKQTDLYYSLPITREKLYFVKALVGLLEVLIPFTVMFWLGFLVIAIKPNDLNLVYYLPAYFAAIPLAVLLFGLNSFVFTRANGIVDGIIFIVFYACALVMFFGIVSNFVNLFILDHRVDRYLGEEYLFSYSAFGVIISRFNALAAGSPSYYVPKFLEQLMAYLVLGIAGVLGWTGLFLFARKEKAENAERISDSRFGYMIMIPFYLVAFLSIASIQSLAYKVIIPMIALIGYIIFRRSVRLKKVDWIVFASAIVLGIAISFFFGLALSTVY